MLILLRILFGAALLYFLAEAQRDASPTPLAGDTTGAYYVAVCVLLALANAVVWAPYLGSKVSDPLTSAVTQSDYVESRNQLLRLVRWLNRRKLRRLTLLFSFLEGVHLPDQPSAFVIGLKNARRGSWLEKLFAKEVFRFDNTQHCIDAFAALQRHGLDPRPHHNPEVNLVLISLERSVRPKASPIPLPHDGAPPPLTRNPKIRLAEALASDPGPTTGLESGSGAASSSAPAPQDEPGPHPGGQEDTTSPEALAPPSESANAEPRPAGILARIKSYFRGD